MALTQRLDLRQSQTLVMTPQLQQAIKLLELNNVELATYVERELEQNPFLEREDDDLSSGFAGGAPPARGPEAQVVPLGRARAGAAPSGSSAGERPEFDDQVARAINLHDHLATQINLDFADPADRAIATALTAMLDEAGYLAGPLEPVAERLGCPLARVEAVLGRLQLFDPPGIFARSLKECLALQLLDRNRLDPAMQALLDHLELLARGNRKELMRICNVDAEDLAEMIAEIKALDPKPALT